MLTTNLSLRAACAALALILVAGCGGGSDDAEPKATKTATSAAPTTPAATTPAAAERPKDDKSDGSAIAFSEFVVKRIVGVTSGEDADTLLTLASDDCSACIELVQKLNKDDAVLQKFDSPPVVTGGKVVDTGGDEYLVEQVLELSPGRKVRSATGETVETVKDGARLTMQVLMTWTDDHWTLTNYSSESS